jgi:hypothetical protein
MTPTAFASCIGALLVIALILAIQLIMREGYPAAASMAVALVIGFNSCILGLMIYGAANGIRLSE